MSLTPLQIKSGDLLLEGMLYAPDDAASTSVVVVCHPHPQRGGDMHNNVVMAIVQALNEAGISAVTFNFRGVGASQGVYANGIGEQEDVKAAIASAAALGGVQRTGLAGYSFGAGVAAPAADESVAALALVSAPTATLQESRLSSYKGPVLMLAGEADHVSSVEALRRLAADIGPRAEAVALPGVDHFWWGHEPKLRQIVGTFFVKALT